MKVKVLYNPLDAKAFELFDVESGTTIIDFLVAEFPQGFGAPVRVISGRDEVPCDQWDKVIDEEQPLVVLVLPAGIEAAVIGQYLLQAAIAVAIGYVINLIFAPTVPGGINDGDESPVYSIGATRNQARLGAPVECIYGTITYPPSFASAPYVYNLEASNDQFVDELLCLGHGKFRVDDILIGNASIYDLQAGSAKWWLFDSSQHLETLGTIEGIINTEVTGTDDPTPFFENMYTSPEVSDYTFEDGQSETLTWQAIDGDAYAQTTDADGNIIPGKIINITRTLLEDPADTEKLLLRSGDKLNLRNTTSNDVEFIIGSVIDGATVSIFQKAYDDQPLVDEVPLLGTAEFELNVLYDNFVAGPFRAQREGDEITEAFCDIQFPQGLYHRDGTDGTIKDVSVKLGFTFQKILANGSPDGAPVYFEYSFRSSTMAPYRGSVSSGPLTQGAYEVTVARVGEFKDERSVETCQWVGLRGAIVLDPTQRVYGDTTMLALRMRATSGLGAAARERVRVKATRLLGEGTSDSANPIVAIKDIWTSPVYGLGRSLDETDKEWLDQLQFDWSGDGGPRFNGAFDSRSTGYEGMQACAALAGANIVHDGGLLTVVPDHIQDVRAAVFTTANIVRDSMNILYTFDSDGDFDGVRIEWRDPSNFDSMYSYYPEDTQNPDTYTLFGCTSKTYAEQFARYLFNIRGRRRKLATLETELEGLLPRFGDRIGISHTMPSWGLSGVFVQEISPTSWYVDQDLEWTADNVLMIRTELGKSSVMYTVTQGATPNIVVFDIEPTELIANADMREPSNYIFGTAENIIRDFMVTKVEPRSDQILSVEAQTYDVEIYDGAPPHMRGETGGYQCASILNWFEDNQVVTYVVAQVTRSNTTNPTGSGDFTNQATVPVYKDRWLDRSPDPTWRSQYYDDYPTSFQPCVFNDPWYGDLTNDGYISHNVSDANDLIYSEVADHARVGMIVYPTGTIANGKDRGSYFVFKNNSGGTTTYWEITYLPNSGYVTLRTGVDGGGFDTAATAQIQSPELISLFADDSRKPLVLVCEVERFADHITLAVWADGVYLGKDEAYADNDNPPNLLGCFPRPITLQTQVLYQSETHCGQMAILLHQRRRLFCLYSCSI